MSQRRDELMLEYLSALREGGKITLDTMRAQRGGLFPSSTLSFTPTGEWVLWTITCRSSAAYDLGCCQCNSHDPDTTETITRDEAIDRLNRLIGERIAEETAHNADAQWITKEIGRLAAEKAAAHRNRVEAVAHDSERPFPITVNKVYFDEGHYPTYATFLDEWLEPALGAATELAGLTRSIVDLTELRSDQAEPDAPITGDVTIARLAADYADVNERFVFQLSEIKANIARRKLTAVE